MIGTRYSLFLVISCISTLDTIQFSQKGKDLRGKGEQVVAQQQTKTFSLKKTTNND